MSVHQQINFTFVVALTHSSSYATLTCKLYTAGLCAINFNLTLLNLTLTKWLAQLNNGHDTVQYVHQVKYDTYVSRNRMQPCQSTTSIDHEYFWTGCHQQTSTLGDRLVPGWHAHVQLIRSTYKLCKHDLIYIHELRLAMDTLANEWASNGRSIRLQCACVK